MKVRISKRAQGDLENIVSYVCISQGEDAADRFLDSARKATEFLAQNPMVGAHLKWSTRH